MSRNKIDYNERMPRFGDYRGYHSMTNGGAGNGISGGVGSGGAPISRRPRRSYSQLNQQANYASQRAVNNILAEFPSDSDVSGAQLRRYPAGGGSQQQYPMPPSPPLTPPTGGLQPQLPAISASRSGGAGRQGAQTRNDDMNSSSEELLRQFEAVLQQEKQQHRQQPPQQQQQQQQHRQQQGRQMSQSRSSGAPNNQRSRRSIDRHYQQLIPEEQLGPQSIQSPPVQDSRYRPKEAALSRNVHNGRRIGIEDKRSFDGHSPRQRYRRPKAKGRGIFAYSDSFDASSSASSRYSSGPEGNEMDSGYAKESFASRPDAGSMSMPIARDRGDRRRQPRGCTAFPSDRDIVNDSGGHQDRSRRSLRRRRATLSIGGDHRKPPPSPLPLLPSVSFDPWLEESGMESDNKRRLVNNGYPKESDGYSSSSASASAAPTSNNRQRFAGWRETSRSEKTILTCPHVELVLLSRTYKCDRCDSCRQRPMEDMSSSAYHREPRHASSRALLPELSDRGGTRMQRQQRHQHEHRGRQYPQDHLQPPLPQHQRSMQWQRQMAQNDDLYDPGSSGGLSDGDSWSPSRKGLRETSIRGSSRQQQPLADLYPRQEASRRQGQPHHNHFDGRQTGGYRRSSKRYA